MSLPATIPAALAELVVGVLLPLILGACGGDAQAARATALRLVAQHQPRTGNELLLTGSAIGYRLRGLAMLVRSADAGPPLESAELAVELASSLSRTGQQAQRQLDELLRAAAGSTEGGAASAAGQLECGSPVARPS